MADISIRAAVKRFGAAVALHPLDLDIAKGEFFTLLGPSGCGKTTLLRMIAGFLPLDAGTLSIGGERADTLPPWRRETGMVFQNYAIFPHLSVFENVAYGLRHRKVARAEIARRVAAALAQVRLTGFEQRLPEHLSGGQKQRVVLARALVIEPRVLLMDEPLSNLDAKLRVELRRDIRLLQQSLGITTLYVTHDQEEALAVSDRIMVMEAGAVRQIGAPRAVYDDPAHVFVAGFIGACNLLAGRFGEGALEVAGARLPLAGSAGPVTVAIRPEDMALVDPADPAALKGVVRLVSFLGPFTRVTVALDGGGEVEMDAPRRAGAAELAAGAPVGMAVAPDALRLFHPETGARLR